MGGGRRPYFVFQSGEIVVRWVPYIIFWSNDDAAENSYFNATHHPNAAWFTAVFSTWRHSYEQLRAELGCFLNNNFRVYLSIFFTQGDITTTPLMKSRDRGSSNPSNIWSATAACVLIKHLQTVQLIQISSLTAIDRGRRCRPARLTFIRVMSVLSTADILCTYKP